MPMDVIGVGLSRTGTTSLQHALEHLGFGRCYHQEHYLQSADHQAFWDRAANGERVDYEDVFADFGASTDAPGNVMYRELMAFYPQAKFVLTVRSPESWFQSISSSVMPPASVEMLAGLPKTGMFKRSYWDLFGGRQADPDYMVDLFERWTAEVQATIPAERLLTYDVRTGWEPLCAFLGRPAPTMEYPIMNSKEEFAGESAGEGVRILRANAAGIMDRYGARPGGR